jgi:hypothetical protein
MLVFWVIMLCGHVDLYSETNVSEEYTASVFSSALHTILRINNDYLSKEH